MMGPRAGRTAPLAVWLSLALIGCGGTIQAEDAQTLALVTRARELYDAGKSGEARAKAELALKRSPQNPQALYLRGLAELKAKDYAAAREDLEKAKGIDPLLVFAKSRDEFQRAWKEARDNTMEALGEGAVETPALPAADQAAAKPAEPTKPDPKQSSDPVVRALAADGAVVVDLSGAGLLAEPEIKAMKRAAEGLAAKRIVLKMATVKLAGDLEPEARRLVESAQLGDDALLVLGGPGGKVAAYTATVEPDVLRADVAEALATHAKASLARRMIEAAKGIARHLEVPPEAPTAPEAAPAAPAAAPAPPAAPPAPAPAPGLPWTTLAGAVGGGALAGILLWVGLARAAARRRLARGFGQAGPHLTAVADRLTGVLTGLLERATRDGAAAHLAAELAFFDAAEMMREAAADRTADIARVERAGRLLAEAEQRLDVAEAALATAPTRPDAAPLYCYFTGRPLTDRWDGDLVALRHHGEERLVLATRAVGDVIRRGQQPSVRVVQVGGDPLHWSRVTQYDPAHDLYHADRFGWSFTPLDKVAGIFFDDAERPVFLTSGERPDYVLDLDRP